MKIFQYNFVHQLHKDNNEEPIVAVRLKFCFLIVIIIFFKNIDGTKVFLKNILDKYIWGTTR